MKHVIRILPGVPNDENRDYLPEAIREGEMVVNENGNNSQVYPKRLRECHGCVAPDGEEDTWFEYVPESYDPSKKTPLVFGMHGGLMTGWGQCIYTSWSLVADREGFICVFPNAHKRRRWQVECEDELKERLRAEGVTEVFEHPLDQTIEENHDIHMILGLIDLMKQKYNIDEGRIYMQGMSLGNAMTMTIARHFNGRFAAMAGSAGPSRMTQIYAPDGSLRYEGGPLAVFQTRVELDVPPPFSNDSIEEVAVKNREFWMKINGCNEIPRIRIIGEDNFAFYHGERADYVLRDVKNRDHGQPFDDAEYMWDYLFSGTRREKDGSILHTPTAQPKEGDAYAYAFSAGSGKVWCHGKIEALGGKAFLWQKLKYHGLKGGARVRGEYMMVPVSFLAKAAGAELREWDDGASAELRMPDGSTLQAARGCIGAVWNNRVICMLCEAVQRDGMLYLPAEWFFQRVLGKTATSYNGVLYATDHYAVLSLHMSRLLRDLLAE